MGYHTVGPLVFFQSCDQLVSAVVFSHHEVVTRLPVAVDSSQVPAIPTLYIMLDQDLGFGGFRAISPHGPSSPKERISRPPDTLKPLHRVHVLPHVKPWYNLASQTGREHELFILARTWQILTNSLYITGTDFIQVLGWTRSEASGIRLARKGFEYTLSGPRRCPIKGNTPVKVLSDENLLWNAPIHRRRSLCAR